MSNELRGLINIDTGTELSDARSMHLLIPNDPSISGGSNVLTISGGLNITDLVASEGNLFTTDSNGMLVDSGISVSTISGGAPHNTLIDRDATEAHPSTSISFPSTADHLTDVQEVIAHMWSPGASIDGGLEITESISGGFVTITDGTALLRNGDLHAVGATLEEYHIPGISGQQLADEATTYFVAGYNNGTPHIAWSTDLGSLYSDPTVVSIYTINRLGDELNVVDNRDFHVNFIVKNIQKDFLINRFEYAGGSEIADEGNFNFSVTAGTFYTLNNAIPAIAIDTSASDTFQYIYRDGASGWTRLDAQTQLDNQFWDDGTGTLNTVGTNDYSVHFVFCILNQPSHYKVLYGQDDYNSLTEAQEASLPSVLPSDLDGDSTAVFIGKIITHEPVTPFADIQSPFTQTLTSTTPTVHNSLAGLDGGTFNEYFHLTAEQHAIMESGQNVVHATASENINIGQVVYMSGTTTGTTPDVSIADNTNFAKSDVLAIANETVTTGQPIIVTTSGLLEGIDTSSFTEGAVLYLGASGALTATHPTGIDAVQRVGHVVVADTALNGGSMIVELTQLTVINDHNGTMRHQVVNQNTGTLAGASYTLVNDANRKVSLSLTGENFIVPFPAGNGKNALTLYNEGYGDTYFSNDGNTDFYWLADEGDTHNFSGLVKMSLSASGNLSVVGDTAVGGDLTVSGNIIQISGSNITEIAQTLTVEDNLILLNKGELGAGVLSGESGIEIDRGTLTNYKFVFRESDTAFAVGVSGDLQVVATREDTPIDTALAFWNDTEKRFDTNSLYTLDSITTDTELSGISGNLQSQITSNDGDIAGLVAISGNHETRLLDLDAKYVDVTGDTMTGTLTISGANLNLPDLITAEENVAQIDDLGNIISTELQELYVPVEDVTSDSADGVKGQWSYGLGFYYKCIATNTWVKMAVVTSF